MEPARSPVGARSTPSGSAPCKDGGALGLGFRRLPLTGPHTTFSPWIIVKANDKQVARLESLRYMLNLLQYEGKDEAPIRLAQDPNVIARFHRKMVELDL
jgi:hypothetical protein